MRFTGVSKATGFRVEEGSSKEDVDQKTVNLLIRGVALMVVCGGVSRR